MPPGPVERWLETFMCKQYADLFEAYGFKTLHSVCQLQPTTLHSMGIPSEHCDKILENVSVLRQSLVASSPEHMGSHDSGLPYGLRHNLQSPHYTGSVGSGYSEQHGYEHQLSGHGQSNNNYSYQPSSYNPSHQQYSSNPGSQVNHGMSYQGNESYSGSQSHYGTPNHQEVYGQPLYNNRLHPGRGMWDDPIGMFNHPSRHVMGSSPPPPSSMMRSPPPPPSTPSTTSMGISHYPRHILDSLPPAAHHHTWTQGQMMGSPRATPSPGIAHASSSISSPSLAGCSPGHGKPFSPPPYSPKPPPAHQHSPVSSYEYSPVGSNPSPSLLSASNRHLSSISSVCNSPSDPLQSLQKMVLLDTQSPRGGGGGTITNKQEQEMTQSHQQQMREDDSNSQQLLLKPTPKFSSVEQLATSSGGGLSSTSPSLSLVSQRTKQTDVSSPSAASVVSIGKSSNIGTPSPDGRTSDSIGGDSNTSAFASNEGSTADELKSSSKNSMSLHSREYGSATNASRSLSAQPKCETMSEDNNSSLDVVGHENDSRQSSPRLLDSTRGHNEGKNGNENKIEQQNGYKSPISTSMRNEAGVWKHDSNAILTNGMPNESYEAKCVKDNQEPCSVDFAVSNLKDLNCLLKPESLHANNVRKNRRKQCLSSFASSRLSPVFAGDESAFKINGDRVGDDEMVELTELKTVTRVGGRKDRLSTTSALDVVHNYDQVQSSYHSVSARPFNCLHQDVNGDSLRNELKAARRRTVRQTDSNPMRTYGPIREDVVGGSNAVKTAIVPRPDSDDGLNRNVVPRESGVKQGSRLEDPSNVTISACELLDSVTRSQDSSLKARRGRPLGSKNKPKPPGFVKEPKRVLKQKAPLPVEPIAVAITVVPLQKKSSVAVEAVQVARKPTTEVKVRGPYVHLSGNNRRGPESVTVVNTFSKDDDVDLKGAGRRKWPKSDESAAFKKKVMTVGFNSTLSANYDVFTKDKTWLCSICKKGSHYKGLGDLFGPYFDGAVTRCAGNTDLSESKSESLELAESDKEQAPVSRKVRAKRKRSELVEDFIKSTMAKKGKRMQRVSCSNEAIPPVTNPNAVDSTRKSTVSASTPTDASTSGHVELWVHEDCLVWSHGVYLLGPKVVGLHDAINEASHLTCSKCHEFGATVGCLQKGCSEQYHYVCAKEKGCHLNEENFTVYCSKHRRKSEPNSMTTVQ